MKLRKREVSWLIVLGVVLVAIRVMDAQTAGMRRKSASAGALPTSGKPALDVEAPSDFVSTRAPGLSEGATLSAADLANLAWGRSPFAGAFTGSGAGLPSPESEEEGVVVTTIGAEPRFSGMASIDGRKLAVLDGRFVPVGGRHGGWRVDAVSTRTVTLREVRTGRVQELVRDRGAAATAAANRSGEADR